MDGFQCTLKPLPAASSDFCTVVSAFRSIKTKCWHCSPAENIVHGTEQRFSISDRLWVHPRRKGEPGLLSSRFSESSNIWSVERAAGTPQQKGIQHGVRSAQLQRCHCNRFWWQRNNEAPTWNSTKSAFRALSCHSGFVSSNRESGGPETTQLFIFAIWIDIFLKKRFLHFTKACFPCCLPQWVSKRIKAGQRMKSSTWFHWHISSCLWDTPKNAFPVQLSLGMETAFGWRWAACAMTTNVGTYGAQGSFLRFGQGEKRHHETSWYCSRTQHPQDLYVKLHHVTPLQISSFPQVLIHPRSHVKLTHFPSQF